MKSHFIVLRFVLVFVIVYILTGFSLTAQDTENRPPITVENAASVVPVGLLDTGYSSVLTISFSPNSQYLLSGHRDGVINEWDLTTGENSSITSPAATWVRAITYSPDGTQIASADGNNIIIWDAETKEQASILEGHTDAVSRLLYSPDGATLASASWDGTIRLWDVVSGESLQELQPGNGDVSFSPNSGILASVEGNFAGIHFWDIANGSSLEDLPSEEVYYRNISFSGDGTLLAGAGSDGNVYVWNMDTRELSYTMEGHDGAVADIGFSPVGSLLVSLGERDFAIRLWDAERGSGFSPLVGDFFSPYTVTFNADGTLFASGGSDGLIYLWGVEEGGQLPLLIAEAFTPEPGHWEGGGSNTSVSFDVNPDGDIINFDWSWQIGTTTCRLNLTEVIDVEANTFEFGPEFEHFVGRFRSSTNLFGISDVTQCGNQFIFTTGGPPSWWVERVSD